MSNIKQTAEIEYYFNRYELHLSGDASTKQRFCIIMVPTSLGVEQVTLRGNEFDKFWVGFMTDRDAIQKLFKSDVDLSNVPFDIINEPQEVISADDQPSN